MNIIESNIANLPTKYGNFRIKAYKDGHQEHLAIMSLDFETLETPFVRIHSECLTGDTLGRLKSDCQHQLDLSLKFIVKNGGLVLYHRQEDRNIGLVNKINAYALQDKGRNTIEANVELGFKEDERDYRVVGYIFENLGVKKLKLITNNPAKLKYVESLGVEIVERIPAIIKSNKYNELYLSTKKEKMGHLI